MAQSIQFDPRHRHDSFIYLKGETSEFWTDPEVELGVQR